MKSNPNIHNESIMGVAALNSPDPTEIESMVFRRLLQHLQTHHEVQNIDLMNLADFCRNCLAKWYVASAEKKGMTVSYEEAREIIYGMPYDEWKVAYQKEATLEQITLFEEKQKSKKTNL